MVVVLIDSKEIVQAERYGCTDRRILHATKKVSMLQYEMSRLMSSELVLKLNIVYCITGTSVIVTTLLLL